MVTERCPLVVPSEAINASAVPPAGAHDQVIDPVKCEDGDPDIRVLWGAVAGADVKWSRRALTNANNDSVVTKVSLGKASLIVTGDLEEDGIVELLKRHVERALRADVYEVGHHGSQNATTKALLDADLPKIALIAVSDRAPRTLTAGEWSSKEDDHRF